jgi:hypothetical protein
LVRSATLRLVGNGKISKTTWSIFGGLVGGTGEVGLPQGPCGGLWVEPQRAILAALDGNRLAALTPDCFLPPLWCVPLREHYERGLLLIPEEFSNDRAVWAKYCGFDPHGHDGRRSGAQEEEGWQRVERRKAATTPRPIILQRQSGASTISPPVVDTVTPANNKHMPPLPLPTNMQQLSRAADDKIEEGVQLFRAIKNLKAGFVRQAQALASQVAALEMENRALRESRARSEMQVKIFAERFNKLLQERDNELLERLLGGGAGRGEPADYPPPPSPRPSLLALSPPPLLRGWRPLRACRRPPTLRAYRLLGGQTLPGPRRWSLGPARSRLWLRWWQGAATWEGEVGGEGAEGGEAEVWDGALEGVGAGGTVLRQEGC